MKVYLLDVYSLFRKNMDDLILGRAMSPDRYGMLLAGRKRKKFKKRDKGRK